MLSPIFNADASLLSILQQAHPSINHFKINESIVQPNSEGLLVKVDLAEETTTVCINKHLFIKRVQARANADRPWAGLRRTLDYFRTEVRFYREFLPLLKPKYDSQWMIAPECYFADCNLDDLLDRYPASDPPSYDESDTAVLNEKGAYLVMESIQTGNINDTTEGNYSYIQESPLTTKQTIQCLQAVAHLHAAAFEDKSLLLKVSERLNKHGGSYHLENRNPQELIEMETSWDTFVQAFNDLAPVGFFNRPSIRDFGKRIKRIAPYVSKELSPLQNDKYATMVHGDYKAMNVFLPNEENTNKPVLIDFASVGVGFGMSDVAMHLNHACLPKDLDNGGEEKLIHAYLTALEHALPNETKSSYPIEIAMRHYRLGCIDYLRFILGRFWKSASLQGFKKREGNRNTTLVNRNVKAALSFVERVDKYLTEIEKEVEDVESKDNNSNVKAD